MWIKVLTVIVGKMPWEKLAAFVMNKAIGKLIDKAPDSLEKAKRYASKLEIQLNLFKKVLKDDKIDSDEVKEIKEAFDAWSKGKPTPEGIKKTLK